MRKIGYYWVMYHVGLQQKSIAFWDGNRWSEIGTTGRHLDDYYYWIGPMVMEYVEVGSFDSAENFVHVEPAPGADHVKVKNGKLYGVAE